MRHLVSKLVLRKISDKTIQNHKGFKAWFGLKKRLYVYELTASFLSGGAIIS